MNGLTLQDDEEPDDSIIIVPAKNRPKKSVENGEMDNDSDGAKPKKKKRYVACAMGEGKILRHTPIVCWARNQSSQKTRLSE